MLGRERRYLKADLKTGLLPDLSRGRDILVISKADRDLMEDVSQWNNIGMP